MDANTIQLLLAVAGGTGIAKILELTFTFIQSQKNGRNGKNGSGNQLSTAVIHILEQQTEILRDIKGINSENGKKLEAISGSLALAMERQKVVMKQVGDIHER